MGIITRSRFIHTTTIILGVEPRISRRGPEYFIQTLTTVFAAARDEVLRCSGEGIATTLAEPDALRRLDQRARTVLALFLRTDRITTADVAGALGLSDRMARVLLGRWVEDGWLEVVDPSRRARAYLFIGKLSAIHRKFIGNGQGWDVSAPLRKRGLSQPRGLFDLCVLAPSRLCVFILQFNEKDAKGDISIATSFACVNTPH